MKKLFFIYLKEKRRILLLSLLFFIIFGIIYNLYAVDWEAYFYAFSLCIFVGTILLNIRFLKFYQKHKQRFGIISSIEHEYENLPFPETLMEQDYQEIVATLANRYHELSTTFETERQDSLDYYTI